MEADGEAAVEIPITGELDLHAFAPRDIASVVEDYVAACQERNILALRLVHGKGTGAQRAVVRRVLRSLPAVVSFGDAPAGARRIRRHRGDLARVRGVTRARDLKSILRRAGSRTGRAFQRATSRAPAWLLAKRLILTKG